MAHKNLFICIILCALTLLYVRCDDENNTDPDENLVEDPNESPVEDPNENPDEETDVETELEDINELGNDQLFIDYVAALSQNMNVLSSSELEEDELEELIIKFPNLNEQEQSDLALFMGFDTYEEFMEYTDRIVEYRQNLQKKYRLDQYDWEVLQPIYDSVSRESFSILQLSTSRTKSSQSTDCPHDPERVRTCSMVSPHCIDIYESCHFGSKEDYRITDQDLNIEGCGDLYLFGDDEAFKRACPEQRVVGWRYTLRLCTLSYWCCIYTNCDDAAHVPDGCIRYSCLVG